MELDLAAKVKGILTEKKELSGPRDSPLAHKFMECTVHPQKGEEWEAYKNTP